MDECTKDYIGDGVYVARHGDTVVLTVEDGISIKQTIHLDSYTMKALICLLKRWELIKN
jgi:hypothetical protein